MSDAAVSYAFEQLEPSDPPPRDATARLLAAAEAEARADPRGRPRRRPRSRAAPPGARQGAAEASAAANALVARRSPASIRCASRSPRPSSATRSSSALSLAGKILAGALQARPELVVEVVQGALRRISDRRRITVLVNPADLDVVRCALGEIAAQGQRRRAVRHAVRRARRRRQRDRAHRRG